MPELPEVETIRAGLAPHILGRRVVAAEILHPRASRRNPGSPLDLAGRLRGRTVGAVARRGKYLWWDLGAEALVVHLGMSGQLLLDAAPAARAGARDPVPASPDAVPSTMVHVPALAAAHVRAVLEFDDGTRLRFVDQRTFGHLQLAEFVETPDGAAGGQGTERALVPAPVAHIARDLLDPSLDRGTTVDRIRTRRTEIKRVLLDQTTISGIGNIYADEALWRSSVHPRLPATAMRAEALHELLESATGVLTDALAAGGTSFDALYVGADGAPGYFARSLQAYGRAGLPCRRCGTILSSERFTNRRSTYCPTCQRVGRPSVARERR